MRRIVPWALLALLVTGVTFGALAGGSAPASSVTEAQVETANPGAKVQTYPFYEGTQLAYVLPEIRATHHKASVLRVPSYDPVGIVSAQWPEPNAAPLGKHYTMYLFVSSGPVQGPRQVLPLADGPPVSDECSQPTYPSADGNSGPALCPNGGVNVSAWVGYAELRLPVLGLGPTATRCQVLATFHGVGDSPEIGLTIPEMVQGFTLAKAYYGWTFDVPGPAAAVQPAWEKSCPQPSPS